MKQIHSVGKQVCIYNDHNFPQFFIAYERRKQLEGRGLRLRLWKVLLKECVNMQLRQSMEQNGPTLSYFLFQVKVNKKKVLKEARFLLASMLLWLMLKRNAASQLIQLTPLLLNVANVHCTHIYGKMVSPVQHNILCSIQCSKL